MAFSDLVAAADRAAQKHLGGVAVSYHPEGGPPADVVGIFDEAYQLLKADAEAGVESSGPAVFLRLADLPVDPEDDEPTLVIAGASYRVVERRPDGLGGIVLVLRLAA